MQNFLEFREIVCWEEINVIKVDKQIYGRQRGNDKLEQIQRQMIDSRIRDRYTIDKQIRDRYR